MSRKSEILIELSFRRGLKQGSKNGEAARKAAKSLLLGIWTAFWCATFWMLGLCSGFFNKNAWGRNNKIRKERGH
jgi:hypothetical protein